MIINNTCDNCGYVYPEDQHFDSPLSYCSNCGGGPKPEDDLEGVEIDDYATIEVNGIYLQVRPCDVIIEDRVMVEWVELGEGWSGDYNEDDPNDEELLRFDVSWLDDNGEWVDPGDASYCTRFPEKAPPEMRRAGLEYIMGAVHEPLMDGHSIKKICEELSWIAPHSFLRDKCPQCGQVDCYYEAGDITSNGRICNNCNHAWEVSDEATTSTENT